MADVPSLGVHDTGVKVPRKMKLGLRAWGCGVLGPHAWNSLLIEEEEVEEEAMTMRCVVHSVRY